ncbi:threonine/serine exporter family protein [Clostridium sp.]|uniref:threonine/serine exporter family protein n=1 Tax=Clostridium sp. TaxID=1506 RepID=UPI002611037A|nr:threonine/serine exporter family protein [Clostridium sp.]
MLLDSLFAFFSTLGFGILFNIKGKNLFYAALGGCLSWFFSVLFVNNGFSTTSSFFLTSVIFSIYSEIFARILKTPVTTLVICALIPLVPGGGMYYTMYEAVTGNIMKSLELGIQTLANAGALAVGIILVSTITRILLGSKKRKEFLYLNKLNRKKKF